MSKQSRIIALIGMITICLCVGYFLGIRRALVTKTNMKIVEGIVQSKERRYEYAVKGGRNDFLEFKLSNINEKIAVSYISKNQADQDSTYSLIHLGKKYKFYIDESYPNWNGVNKGINIIEYNGITVFKKSHKFELYAGIFFIIISIVLAIFGIKKFKNKTTANSGL